MIEAPKKQIWLVICLMLLIAVLAGCGSNGNSAAKDDGRINVVTSFYPLYFFAKEIGGDDAHVDNLIAAGVEPHDWTPKSRDLNAVSKAKLFIYNGAGLEGWVDGFLRGLGSDNQVMTVEASKGIALIHGNPEEDADHEEHGGLDVDPHTWVSPRSALVMATNIRDAFIQADPDRKAGYEARYVQLQQRLMQLDEKFSQELSGYERRDIVVSHQAFGYLCRDYGLNQIAIMGLSPDAEPRAKDLLKIAKFVKDNKIPYIFFEELVSEQLADTLASEAHVKTLVLNPLEGLTEEQEKAGNDYFSLSERNLQNLQKALQ
ncbi:ABC transporter substrate-binding protein [Cohnella endophytica]|uniref:ABC transporter substrate-binding protein n=1 Tax=Cohnella endophytica TaxID=2419778 RepID=A0A494Y944_9BACL|nr:metal ABC transporter substrate-binding protein [Cohnella endophytica]RKP57193.1 ABC transporter substrate-binding protein [Cohnella endophytica]